MADGFGFRFDADQTAAPAPVLLEPAQAVQGAEADTVRHIVAGGGAAPPESWWGELVEFATPLLACVGFAVVTASLSPGGWALLGVGFP